MKKANILNNKKNIEVNKYKSELDYLNLKNFIKKQITDFNTNLIVKNNEKNIEVNKYKSELHYLNLKNFIKKEIIDFNTNLIVENNEKSCITKKDFINSLKIKEEKKSIEIEKNNKNPELEINRKNTDNIENLILENCKKIKNPEVNRKQNIRDNNELLQQIEDFTGINLGLIKKKEVKIITKNDVIDNLLSIINS